MNLKRKYPVPMSGELERGTARRIRQSRDRFAWVRWTASWSSLAEEVAPRLVSMVAVAGLVVSLVATAPAHASTTCTAEKLAPVTYQAFDQHTETLTPWQGSKVAVLVEPGVTRSATVMSKLVCALDRAWSYYQKTTGKNPTLIRSANGRVDVAEVSSTFGNAGSTYFGEGGTEIQTTYFEYGYKEIANSNLFDQVPFYEFGRSFWYWSSQLEDADPCTHPDPQATGFAVWMRFRSMAAAEVAGAPLYGSSTPFNTFKSQVAGLKGVYDANTSDTFAGTLCQNTSPGMYGGTDFWASIMMKLASLYGNQMFVSRFFHNLGVYPGATSTPSAINNWLSAVDYAACNGLSSVFYQRWGFPRPDGSVVNPRPTASSVPFPAGHC